MSTTSCSPTAARAQLRAPASSTTTEEVLPTATRSCELHLLAEEPAQGRPRLAALVPGPGLSYLVPGRKPAALSTRKPRRPAIVLEPVTGRFGLGAERCLLALVPSGLGARWNALPAPPVVCLRVGDALRVPGGPILHLAEHVSTEPGAPPPEMLDRPCSGCRGRLEPGSRLLRCWRCDAPAHFQEASERTPEPLVCIDEGDTCPSCGAVARVGGDYRWFPEHGELHHA
jgi:hypothetical protein